MARDISHLHVIISHSCADILPSVLKIMVYFSNRHSRTPAQKGIRILLGITVVTLIIYTLSQVPYDILREERFRLFGEEYTTGIVTDLRTQTNGDRDSQFIINYKYIDQDGFARQAEASLPREIWSKYHPSSRIRVMYARTKPGLSRIKGEIEPKFQIWLRNLLD